MALGRSRFLAWFLYTLGVGVFVYLFLQYDIVGAVSSAEGNPSRYWFLVLSGLLFLAVPVFRALRWKYVAGRLGIASLRLGSALAQTSASFFVSLITPGKAGEFLRFLFSDADRMAVLVGTYTEFCYDMLALAALSVVAAAVYLPSSTVLPVSIAIAGFSIVMLALVVTSAMEKVVSWFALRRGFSFVQRATLGPDMKSGLRDPKLGLICFGVGLSNYGVAAFAAYSVFHFLGYPIAIDSILAATVLGRLAGLASLIPMGLGSREVSSLAFLSLRGYDSDWSAAGLMITRLFTLLPAAVGLVSYVVIVRAKAARVRKEQL